MICTLIGREDQERQSSTTTAAAADKSPHRHVAAGPPTGQQHTGSHARRSPSPTCYRRRSPTARAAPQTEEGGAVGGELKPSSAGRPKSPASPRRSRHNDNSTAHQSPRQSTRLN